MMAMTMKIGKRVKKIYMYYVFSCLSKQRLFVSIGGGSLWCVDLSFFSFVKKNHLIFNKYICADGSRTKCFLLSCLYVVFITVFILTNSFPFYIWNALFAGSWRLTFVHRCQIDFFFGFFLLIFVKTCSQSWTVRVCGKISLQIGT